MGLILNRGLSGRRAETVHKTITVATKVAKKQLALALALHHMTPDPSDGARGGETIMVVPRDQLAISFSQGELLLLTGAFLSERCSASWGG